MSKSNKVALPVQGPLDTPISITRFPDQYANSKKELRVTPRKAARQIPELTAPSKSELAFYKLARFGDSPTTKGCLRSNDNVLDVSGGEGDHDAGTMTLDEAKKLLKEAGIAALLYETPSNTPEAPRWRVWVFFSKALQPAMRVVMMARLNGVLRGVLAGESFVLSQSYYAGSVKGRDPVRTILVEGDYIDQRDDLDQHAIGKPGRTTKTDHEKETLDEEASLRQIETGDVMHTNMVALAGKWSAKGIGYGDAEKRLRKALEKIPEEKRDARWHERLKEIPTVLKYAYGKRVAEQIAAMEMLDDLEEEANEIFQDADKPVRSLERERADRQTEWSDTWAGARHADRLRGKRLYVSATGQVLAWNGVRWVAQTLQEIVADAKETTAELLTDSAERFRDDPSPENRAAHKRAMQLHGSSAAINRMIESAWSESEMHVSDPSIFDADPTSFTCTNGIADLRTGTLRRARPEDLVSKIGGCKYDPEAEAPMFFSFLEQVQPDPEVRDFLQVAAGYSLTGLVDEERFLLCYGTGRNGKSVFANILRAVFGEFAMTLSAAAIVRTRNDGEAERAKAALPGKRLALVDETGTGDVFDAGRVKNLTSREQLAARFLYKESFNFTATHKLWVRTNHLPGSLDASDGFWRRCTPIPFITQIAEKDIIADLDRQIIAKELPGVLAWAVEGAKRWFREGLQIPESIRQETAAYREETDLLGQWLEERTREEEGAEVTVATAFSDFAIYCANAGAKSGTKMSFARQMTDRGFKRAPGTSVRRFVGFRLLSVLEKDEDVGTPDYLNGLDVEARALM